MGICRKSQRKTERCYRKPGIHNEDIEALSAKLKVARKEEDVHHAIDVIRPVNYVESYDTAITQLEWTVDKEVELDQHEFAQYVEDKWSWSNMFTQTRIAYGKV